MQNERNQWIDIAKGITIILMVLGHSSLPQPISRFIWSFHMPLFFIASGWMTKWEKYNFKEFTMRKIRTLAVPFLCYSAIVLLWLFLLFEKDVYAWIINGWEGLALWFIPVLFISLLIARLIFLIKNDYIRYGVFTFLGGLGYSLCYYGIIFPWTLSTIPYATFLVFAGSRLRTFQRYIDKPNFWIGSVSLIITITVSQLWRLDLCCNQIIPIVPLTLGAFAGTLLFFTLSSVMKKNTYYCSKLLQSIGKETLIVVAFSQIIIMTINQYITHFAPIKYTMLIVLLVVIKYLKDWAKKNVR